MTLTSTVAIPFQQTDYKLFLSIASVLNQSRGCDELILIRDGAGSASFSKLRNRFPRLQIVEDGYRRGLASRLNQIAQMSRSDVLVRMDADDMMMPGRLAVQMDVFESQPAIEVVGARAIAIDGSDSVLGSFREPQLLPLSSRALVKGVVFSHPTVATRRLWSLKNPYDETFARAQDRELWIRTFNRDTFLKLQDPLLLYRLEASSSLEVARRKAYFDRRIILQHGPSLIGWPRTLVEVGMSHLKTLVRVGAARVNLATSLEARRVEEMPGYATQVARIAIRKARALADEIAEEVQE